MACPRPDDTHDEREFPLAAGRRHRHVGADSVRDPLLDARGAEGVEPGTEALLHPFDRSLSRSRSAQ